MDGNQSGVIQIKNPFYGQSPAIEYEEVEVVEVTEPDIYYYDSYSVSQVGPNPLTPDGTGTVVDNVTDGDGKEFFTVFTEEGHEFFLIVDRHRNTDNVYLLNAVTVEDLMALASPSNNTGISAIPSPVPEPEPTPEPTQPEPSPEPEPEAIVPQNSGNGSIIIILIIVGAVGGAAYYFKVIKGKDSSGDMDDEDEEYNDGIVFEDEVEEVEDDADLISVSEEGEEGGDNI